MDKMKFIDKPIDKKELEEFRKRYRDYVKITADISNDWLVIGTELHADGEKVLLEKGSSQDDIWAGGIDLKDKIIDMTAVLNLRPGLGNNSMEILDPARREKFVKMVRKYFGELWR